MGLWLNGEEVWICPECGGDWHDKPIPVDALQKGYYGEWDGVTARFYSRLIGVYSRERDRTVAWRCPDCGKEWPRG